MKIKAVETKNYKRKFNKPLVTSKGAITEQRGLIIRITADNDLCGYGEISPIGGLSDASRHEIEAITQKLIGREIATSPDNVARLMISLKTADGYGQFGFESALCDLAARVAKQPLAIWMGSTNLQTSIPVNYLMSWPIGDWDELAKSISRAGYRAVKLKIGSGSPDDDVAFIIDASKRLPSDISLRLDANQGYDFEMAIRVFKSIDLSRIEYVEEPLVGADPEQLMRLKKLTGIKIALDESVSDYDRMEALSGEKFCNAIIIKPARLGSLLKARSAVSSIIKNDCKAVCTSTLESEIGIAAQLHLVASLNIDLPPCGLDTLRLFENFDDGRFSVNDGKINLPDGIGLGCGDALWDNL